MDRLAELECTSEARETPETVEEESQRGRSSAPVRGRYTGDIPGIYRVFTGEVSYGACATGSVVLG
jgi:hypothetical protein